MKPEEWQQGMENEADSVEDDLWARETRWAAWWQRRGLELRRTMSWGPLTALLIAGAPPFLIFIPFSASSEQPIKLQLIRLCWNVAQFLTATPELTLLLLLLWVMQYAQRGHAAWTLASLASLVSPMYVLLILTIQVQTGLVRGWSLPSSLLSVLAQSAGFIFCLSAALAWAIHMLHRTSRRPA